VDVQLNTGELCTCQLRYSFACARASASCSAAGPIWLPVAASIYPFICLVRKGNHNQSLSLLETHPEAIAPKN